MKAFFRLAFGCLALSLLAGCGGDSGPPDDQIAAAVQQHISDNWGFKLKQSEAFPLKEMGGKFYNINYAGVIVLKEPQYKEVTDTKDIFKKRGIPYPAASNFKELEDDSIDDQEKQEIIAGDAKAVEAEEKSFPVFVAKTADAGDTFEVSGRCVAEKRLDEWDIRCPRFENITGDGDSAGQTMSETNQRYSGKQVAVVSPEADAFFAKFLAKRQERKNSLATRFKHRQELRARTEAEWARAEAQYLPHVSNNQVYEGTLTYWERHLYAAGIVQSGTLPIRISFSMDGRTVKARIVNISLPDEGVDREERREMESFWPVKGQQYAVDTAQFPLMMKTTRGWTRHNVPGRKPIKIPRFFSEPDPVIGGYGFKFEGNTLSGSLRNDDTDYKISATVAGH